MRLQLTRSSLQLALLVLFAGGLARSVHGDGACCMVDGTCATEPTHVDCITAGGTYLGDNSSCLEIDCGIPATVMYVDLDATPGGDGATWATAFTDPQRALEVGRYHPSVVREIWVAEGLYTPTTPGGDRLLSFELHISGQAMYGGFDGTETKLAQRDPSSHVTILSGDLNGDDGPDFAGNDENSYTVVRTGGTGACVIFHLNTCVDGLILNDCEGLGGTFLGYGTGCASSDERLVLEGFTITGANGNGNDNNIRWGGGIRNITDNLTVRQCVLTANYVLGRGAGMMDSGGDTIVDGCDFLGNLANSRGGGYSSQGAESPLISFCHFESNHADRGGAAWAAIGTTPDYVDCVFTGNTSSAGGALYLEDESAFPHVTFTRCQVTGNDAVADGGGVYIEANTTFTAIDCNFVNNGDVAVRNRSGSLTVNGGSFTGNTDRGAIRSGGPSTGDNTWIDDVTFSGNSSVLSGGAFYLSSGGAVISNCQFDQNTSSISGGAIYMWTWTRLDLFGCQLSGNIAPDGSAIFNEGAVLRGDPHILSPDVFCNTGELHPGASDGSFGVVTIDGTYEQRQSTATTLPPRLVLRVGGVLPGTEFDQLDASNGTVEISEGTLLVDLDGGFLPSSGDSFMVMPYGNLIGGFTLGVMPTLDPSLHMVVEDDGSAIYATVSALANPISFTAVPSSALGTGTPMDAELSDLNGDATLDLVVLMDQDVGGGEVMVAGNQGSSGGTWLGFETPALAITVGEHPRALVAAPLDGDNTDDLAVAVWGQHVISVLLNPADGSFNLIHASDETTSGFPVSIDAGTSTGDLSLDLVTACTSGRQVRPLRNDGSGQFTEGDIQIGSDPPLDAVFVDFTNDGHDDLVIVRDENFSNPDYAVLHVWNPGSNLFDFEAAHTLPARISVLRKGDLDGDGRLDVFAVSFELGTISIFMNTGTGMLSPISINLDAVINDVVVVDLDLDGDLDLVAVVTTTEGNPRLRVIRNDTDGGPVLVLATAVDLDAGSQMHLLRSGDVDGDGDADLVAIGAPSALSGTTPITVYLNNTGAAVCPPDLDGNGSVGFSDLLMVLTSWGPCPECPADIDGDGTVGFADLLTILSQWGPCE